MNEITAIVDAINDGAFEQAAAIFNETSHLATAVGVKITTIKRGYAEGELQIEKNNNSVANNASNGPLLVLIDSVSGIAVSSFGIASVTMSSCVNFVDLACVGTVRCKAKSQYTEDGFVMVETIVSDGSDLLIATGTLVFKALPNTSKVAVQHGRC